MAIYYGTIRKTSPQKQKQEHGKKWSREESANPPNMAQDFRDI